MREPKRPTPRRLALAAGVSAAAAGAALAWGAIESHLFTVRDYRIPILPAGTRPLRILQVSDLHLIPEQADKIAWVRELATLEPDFVLNTGDNFGSPKRSGRCCTPWSLCWHSRADLSWVRTTTSRPNFATRCGIFLAIRVKPRADGHTPICRGRRSPSAWRRPAGWTSTTSATSWLGTGSASTLLAWMILILDEIPSPRVLPPARIHPSGWESSMHRTGELWIRCTRTVRNSSLPGTPMADRYACHGLVP